MRMNMSDVAWKKGTKLTEDSLTELAAIPTTAEIKIKPVVKQIKNIKKLFV